VAAESRIAEIRAAAERLQPLPRPVPLRRRKRPVTAPRVRDQVVQKARIRGQETIRHIYSSVLKATCEFYQTTPGLLPHRGPTRAVSRIVAHELAGCSINRFAHALGLDHSTVVCSIQRAREVSSAEERATVRDWAMKEIERAAKEPPPPPALPELLLELRREVDSLKARIALLEGAAPAVTS